MMGRSLSPLLQKELEKNLDLDMKSNEGLFSTSADNEVPNDAISLDEVDNIMGTIIKTLKSSTKESFPLHSQSCLRAISAIARYGMGPTTPEEKKQHIVRSLAKPLSDCLLATQETLSSGAALCLKSLVDSDNWRFASNKTVNHVCQTVSGALEKHREISSHMELVMSLAKHNSLVIEAYARLLVQCGLRVLRQENDHTRLLAVVMISCLMRYLDPRSMLSEMGMIVEELRALQESPDETSCVRVAAFEALQLGKTICSENLCEFGDDSATTSWPRSMSTNRRLWKRHENDAVGLIADNNSSHFYGKNKNSARSRRRRENRDRNVESSRSDSSAELKSFRKDETKLHGSYTRNYKRRMICVFLILVVAILAFSLWGEYQDGVYNLVPT
ncbi:unnamed protein product [Cuscuta campestris]|uniref:Uncharacterized protein n=1 Tax=Cuscuta campestris TaxID=132261 RepID=A0A484MQC4_9ASTE|nr:unnamed protein product [Cuscuta campestris]